MLAELSNVRIGTRCLLQASEVVLSTSSVRLQLHANSVQTEEASAKTRRVVAIPIEISLLPPATMIREAKYCVLNNENCILKDALPEDATQIGDVYRTAPQQRYPMELVADDCVVLTTGGEFTWSRWVTEALPIIAAIEASSPHHFRYGIPQVGGSDLITGILQSLATYGVDIPRVVWIRRDVEYHLSRAWFPSSAWSNGIIHPEALNLLRRPIKMDRRNPSKIAFLRRDALRRVVTNVSEVRSTLIGQGFYVFETGHLSFAQMAGLFASASVIFGILGSGFSGLTFAHRHVRTIAARPAGWNDLRYQSLAELLGGRWIDLQGISRWTGHDGTVSDAPFKIETGLIASAIRMADDWPPNEP